MEYVKIITANYPNELESKINEWSANTHAIEILDVKYQVTPHQGNALLFSALIVYKKYFVKH